MVRTELSCILEASKKYKEMVSKKGPDGKPGLNDKYSAEDFEKIIKDNIDEFRQYILSHPFFAAQDYDTLKEVYENDYELFMYCFQVFINNKIGGTVGDITSVSEGIEVDPNTLEPISAEINTEDQNKKEFVKEVLDGVPRKKTLKEFFDEVRSYKQFRDCVDDCIFYMDWDKIHKTMKVLKWKWASWFDEYEDEHCNTVPSVYGIREFVINELKKIENWVNEHPEAREYHMSCGGFEFDLELCEDNDEVDDFEHQVILTVKFVLEQYDNCC